MNLLDLEGMMFGVGGGLLCGFCDALGFILGLWFRFLFAALDLEGGVDEEDVVDVHLGGGVDADDVAVSDQEPLGGMAGLDDGGVPCGPKVQALGVLDHQEAFLAVVASLGGKTDAQGGKLEELAQAVAVWPEHQEADHMLQVRLELFLLTLRVGLAFRRDRRRLGARGVGGRA
ncbi:hypothetical protein KEM55_000569 [Ascosphaera atra]|nr:hypothetical protein KEM55_000569 [Ascosphaera atra]